MTDEPTPTEPAAEAPKPAPFFSALADHPDNPKLKELKARAQLTQVSVKISHDGISERLIRVMNDALDQHEMVKVKFVALKDQKRALSRVLEAATNSMMVQRVGHTATYFRAKKSE